MFSESEINCKDVMWRMGVAMHLFIMSYLFCPGDLEASQGMQCLVNILFSQQSIVICAYTHF